MQISLNYSDWIPVDKNHPPQIGKQVLITYKSNHIVEKQISTAIYLGDNTWELPNGFRTISTTYISDYVPISVLAWMELPKPF